MNPSPKNQLDFLQRLHTETLPFSAETYRVAKRVMIEKEPVDYTLRAKTGWADTKPEHIGCVETPENVYFFTTRIYQPDDQRRPDFGDQRKTITRNILVELGITLEL